MEDTLKRRASAQGNSKSQMWWPLWLTFLPPFVEISAALPDFRHRSMESGSSGMLVTVLQMLGIITYVVELSVSICYDRDITDWTQLKRLTVKWTSTKRLNVALNIFAVIRSLEFRTLNTNDTVDKKRSRWYEYPRRKTYNDLYEHVLEIFYNSFVRRVNARS